MSVPASAALSSLIPIAAAFTLSQFYRSAAAVIAPELSRELGLSPDQLGMLSAAYMVGFAVLQIPVGVALDRYGTRVTLPPLLGLAVVGALWFAMADGFEGLLAAQALMGAGTAGTFMGAAVIVARWYPADRYATMSAVMVAVGGIGYLLSATPLAWAVENFGWRVCFLVTAGFTAVSAVAVAGLVRDAPPGHPFHSRRPETVLQTLRGVGAVLRNPPLWLILPICFFGYAAMIAVRGLWAGPYLQDVHQLGTAARGDILLLMSVAYIAGTLAYGPMDRLFNSRKKVILAGGIASLALLLPLALVPGMPLWLVVALLVLFSPLCCFYQIGVVHARATFPDALVGRGITVVNLMTLTGASTMQLLTGVVVGSFPTTPDGGSSALAYQAMFGTLALSTVLALALYSRARDVPPR